MPCCDSDSSDFAVSEYDNWAALGREPSFDSEVVSVGYPIHCSYRKLGDRKTPDSRHSIGGVSDSSTSQFGQVETNNLESLTDRSGVIAAPSPTKFQFSLTVLDLQYSERCL